MYKKKISTQWKISTHWIYWQYKSVHFFKSVHFEYTGSTNQYNQYTHATLEIRINSDQLRIFCSIGPRFNLPVLPPSFRLSGWGYPIKLNSFLKSPQLKTLDWYITLSFVVYRSQLPYTHYYSPGMHPLGSKCILNKKLTSFFKSTPLKTL